MNQIKKAGEADIIPTDVSHNGCNLFLCPGVIHDPKSQSPHNLVLTRDLEALMLQNLLEVVCIHETNHGVICVHVEALTYGWENHREHLVYFQEYLNLESFPCLLLMLNDIFNHKAFDLAYYAWALVWDYKSIENGCLVV